MPATTKRNYVKIACNRVENEVFLRNYDSTWQEILDHDKFCRKLFSFTIYRFSFTNEELDELLCPLIDNVQSTVEYEILKIWRRKTGKLGNKC